MKINPINPDEIKSLPIEKELDEDWFKNAYEQCYVDLNKKYERPEVVISIGDYEYKDKTYPNEVMTAGEFSVISAPSKSKKSFLKSVFGGSYIGGETSEYFPIIKGHRNNRPLHIIDCDTEQSQYYSQKTFNRTIEISKVEYPYYFPFKMRHLSPEQRVAFIDRILESDTHKGNVKLIFIDGVADLIEDTNDLVMSNYIAEKLLKWTDVYNIHVSIVIHNAYGTKKPTGHLGSAIVKKAETVILLTPTDDSKEIIEVSALYSRGRAFENFFFKIYQGLPYQCDTTGRILNRPKRSNDEFEDDPEPLPTFNPSDAFDLDDNDFKDDHDVPF